MGLLGSPSFGCCNTMRLAFTETKNKERFKDTGRVGCYYNEKSYRVRYSFSPTSSGLNGDNKVTDVRTHGASCIFICFVGFFFLVQRLADFEVVGDYAAVVFEYVFNNLSIRAQFGKENIVVYRLLR